MATTPAQQRGLDLIATMSDVARLDAPLPRGLTLFGVGQAQVMAGLDALERRTRRSAWNMNPNPSFDPEDAAYELEDRSTARGVDLQMVTTPRTVRLNPLLTSFSPKLLLGPVTTRLIVVDQQVAVLQGPDTTAGETTAWIATSGDLLQAALDVWAAVVAESQPALPDGAAPPLNHRQLAIARAVCLGNTDAAIARAVGVSQRTVERDISVIMTVTQATSRAEAVLNMLGRGRQSRT